MKIVRTTLSTLVAALMVLLAACSQAPAPQAEKPAEDPTIANQAVTTTIDFGNWWRDFQPYTEDGYTLTSVGNGGNTASGGVRVIDAFSPGNSFAFPNFGFHDQDILLRNVAALPFNLSSLDLLETNSSPSPQTFTVQGTRTDGTLVEQTFTTDGVAGRETFLLSNFSKLTSVRLGAGASTRDVAVDNLILDVVVPDTTPPVVTINQAALQADPSGASPITFTAEFSEDVTGFDGSDVTLSGTAGATTAVVSGGPTTYTIQVSGMTTSGTVIASLAAGVATDAAGNGNTASTSSDNEVSYLAPDTTPPTASPSISDKYGNALQANAAGWYNKTVTVTWNWSDEAGGSGIDTANCETLPTSVSHGRVTLSTTCADVAGNQGSASLVVKVDTVAPSISYVGASPASPNAQGWYNSTVTASFTGTDATSGIASCPSRTLGEGVAITTIGTCTDIAGNRKSLTTPAFNVDKTKPTVNVLMNGSVVSGTTLNYSLAQGIPTASCTTTDALSGVATLASLSFVKVTTLGEVAATNPPTTTGTYRAKCLGALDNADNANARTVSFKVTR